jgi:predicted AAA+ superfamily ATPase
MIDRQLIVTVREKLFKGKAIIITGARQVGKTTLLKKIASEIRPIPLFLNCDETDVRMMLTDTTSSQLSRMAGNNRVVIIDEGQRVKNIGLTLKLFTDELPEIQLIVSGSSALDLANQINEPLTGRKFEYNLFPMARGELVSHYTLLEENRLLEDRLIFGSYPEIVTYPDDRIKRLTELTGSYLYKDLFNFQEIRKPELLQLLLEALALQIGNEVSYSELAQTVHSNSDTVKRYIDLFEKLYIIFRLRAFSRNLRNELKKSRKIYFYDNGIRNVLIRNFNPLNIRSDTGALWENYLVSERKKRNSYDDHFCNTYFWRTKQQQEIDYIEEYEGKLHAYEFKWSPKANHHFSKTFLRAYPNNETKIIHRDNLDQFL